MTAQELKNSILQLAVQGKLVPQSAEDEPAVELVKRIITEKQRHISSGAIKKEKALPPITEDELPFDIPETWAWVRLSDISNITAGGTPSRTITSYWNGDIPWVKISDISDKYVNSTEECITQRGLDNSSAKVFSKGTLLYTIFATIGTVGILNIDAATNQAIAGVTFYGEYDLDYMYYVAVGLKDLLVAKGKGMAQMNINQTILKSTPIPIPPLAEQRRIVAKIEELLPLVSEYDGVEKRISALNTEFPDKLRKSILQQAMQGKLTDRDPSDEPAVELLKRINAEKVTHAGARKTRKGLVQSPIAEDEKPFDLPDTWEWVRFTDVIDVASNLVQPNDYLDYMHIAPDNIEKGTGKLFLCRTVAEDKVSSPNHLFGKNQLIYSKIRPLLRKVAIAPFDGLCSADMYPLKTILHTNYVKYVILSDVFNNQVAKIASTRVKMPKINQTELGQIIIPLPPLDEQRRIADRIEELLAACKVL